jgi:hypothetical protein
LQLIHSTGARDAARSEHASMYRKLDAQKMADHVIN